MKPSITLICLLILTCLSPALGVIPAKMPLPKLYETSDMVLVARVTKLNPSNRLIDADVTEAIKGAKTEKLRIQVVSPEGLFGQIHEGDPLVICTARGRGAGTATVHLADTFLLASLKAQNTPPFWQIIQEQSNDFKKTFPGTTNLLIQALSELKNQKPTFLNSADDRHFTEGSSEVAQLKLTATNLFSTDLNGDGTSELIISTPHGPRIFTRSGQTYQDTPDTSLPTSGDVLAVGDLNGDSKPDLLIDNTPYLNQGGSFKAAAPIEIPVKNQLAAVTIAEGKIISLSRSGQLSIGSESHQLWKESQPPLAAVIGLFDESNKPAVVAAFENSLMRYSLDGRSADFPRLTGEPLSSYLKESAGQFKNPKLIPLDANGDGRRDLLVLSEGPTSCSSIAVSALTSSAPAPPKMPSVRAKKSFPTPPPPPHPTGPPSTPAVITMKIFLFSLPTAPSIASEIRRPNDGRSLAPLHFTQATTTLCKL